MRLARIRIVIVVVAAALAAAIFGITRLVAALDTPPQATQVGTLGGLNAQVTSAGWVDMDHSMSTNAPGYQMPPAMMPGMPEQGKERIAVTVQVVNPGNDGKAVRPAAEFALHAGKDDELIIPHSDTFGELPRLAGHNAVSGVLFFDLPPGQLDDSTTWLEWSHDGTRARLTLPLNGVGSGPVHQHNP